MKKNYTNRCMNRPNKIYNSKLFKNKYKQIKLIKQNN